MSAMWTRVCVEFTSESASTLGLVTILGHILECYLRERGSESAQRPTLADRVTEGMLCCSVANLQRLLAAQTGCSEDVTQTFPEGNDSERWTYK
jgi:hypothetical protein